MSKLQEKLQGVDDALTDLGVTDESISEVRQRFAEGEATELQAVDAQLADLADGATIDVPSASAQPAVSLSEPVDASWDDESTEVEVLDESDFELLVDEDDLEELEKVGEDDAVKTTPPDLPQGDEEEGDGFFKKLFGNRRSRPPQP